MISSIKTKVKKYFKSHPDKKIYTFDDKLFAFVIGSKIIIYKNRTIIHDDLKAI